MSFKFKEFDHLVACSACLKTVTSRCAFQNEENRNIMCGDCYGAMLLKEQQAEQEFINERRGLGHDNDWSRFETNLGDMRRYITGERTSALQRAAERLMADNPQMSFGDAACLASEVEGAFDAHRRESYTEGPAS